MLNLNSADHALKELISLKSKYPRLNILTFSDKHKSILSKVAKNRVKKSSGTLTLSAALEQIVNEVGLFPTWKALTVSNDNYTAINIAYTTGYIWVMDNTEYVDSMDSLREHFIEFSLEDLCDNIREVLINDHANFVDSDKEYNPKGLRNKELEHYDDSSAFEYWRDFVFLIPKKKLSQRHMDEQLSQIEKSCFFLPWYGIKDFKVFTCEF